MEPGTMYYLSGRGWNDLSTWSSFRTEQGRNKILVVVRSDMVGRLTVVSVGILSQTSEMLISSISSSRKHRKSNFPASVVFGMGSCDWDLANKMWLQMYYYVSLLHTTPMIPYLIFSWIYAWKWGSLRLFMMGIIMHDGKSISLSHLEASTTLQTPANHLTTC